MTEPQPERVIRWRAMPKQLEFIRAQDKQVLYSGALGAGKTLALGLKLLSRAVVPRSREILVRKVGRDLHDSTLKTLLQGDGDLPPVLPPGSYVHNRQRQTITIHGAGEILYRGLDDPARIGSINLSGAAVDEASELSEEDWRLLLGRIRLDLPGLTRQVYGACNPGPPTHHLAKTFGLALGHQPAPGTRAIHTRTNENRHLPADYLASLEANYSGVAYRRYVLGQWVGSDGLVYDTWDREVHLAHRNVQPARLVVGIDDGYSNPFAALLGVVDGDGRLHILRMVYQSGLLVRAKVQAVRDLLGDLRPKLEAIVVDPAAAQLIAELTAADLPVTAANNEVIPGIERVRQRLQVLGDGLPRLTADPSCTHLAAEMETYEWARGQHGIKDQPTKAHDHAMDALRYLASYLAVDPLQVW